jgi:hypothetical protein
MEDYTAELLLTLSSMKNIMQAHVRVVFSTKHARCWTRNNPVI